MKLRYSASIACTKAASAACIAVERGKRRERQRAPDEGDLAVVVVPDFREQQRPGGDRQQHADERQRPRPAHRRAVERRRKGWT